LSYQKFETYPALKRSKKNSMIKEGLNQDEIEVNGWHLPGQEPKKADCGKWSFMGSTAIILDILLKTSKKLIIS